MTGAAHRATSEHELLAFETATRDLAGLALRSTAGIDISLPQLRLLLVLADLGRSTSTACARALGIAGSSVTRLADRLDASGHLTRGADATNRSVVTLELTGTGHDVVAEVTRRRREELQRVLDQIDPAERRACAAVLDRLHELWAPDAVGVVGEHLPL